MPCPAAISLRRRRSSSAKGIAACAARQEASVSGGQKASKRSKQASCASIRCSRAPSPGRPIAPAANAAAPAARSWPANSLPCMRLNSATSRRDTVGSAATSAASKTRDSSAAITRLKRSVASCGAQRRCAIASRSSARPSSACSAIAMRVNRRAPPGIACAGCAPQTSGWASQARTAPSAARLAVMRAARSGPKRTPAEAR